MSVDEIGRVFSEQRELGETIRHWRSHRADLVARGEGPVAMAGPVTTLFHVIPVSAFSHTTLRESWKLSEEDKNHIHVPHGINSCRYNADGFLGLVQAGNNIYAYTQVFRSGIIEYADGQCSGSVPIGPNDTWIYGQEIERQMISCYGDAVTRLRKQGKTHPLYVGLSLIGIKGKNFYSTPMHSVFGSPIARQNTFVSPEVFVDINEPENHPYPKTLLPLADTMWQLVGPEGTPFKPKGVWEPFKEYS